MRRQLYLMAIVVFGIRTIPLLWQTEPLTAIVAVAILGGHFLDRLGEIGGQA